MPQVPHRSSFETILRGCLAKCNIVRSPLRQYVTICVKTSHFVNARLRFELRVRSPPVFPTGNQAHRMFAHALNSQIQLVTRMLGAQRPSTEGWFSRVQNNNCPGVHPRLLHPPLCQTKVLNLYYNAMPQYLPSVSMLAWRRHSMAQAWHGTGMVWHRHGMACMETGSTRHKSNDIRCRCNREKGTQCIDDRARIKRRARDGRGRAFDARPADARRGSA